MKCKYNFLIWGATLLWCAGCVSLVDKAGRVLDGSAFAEKKISVYRSGDMEIREVQNRAGERSVIITMNQYPTMKLRGAAPDENGAFYLVSLDYLGGNTNGWNEYRLDLSGTGNLVLSETTARLFIPDEIESVGISSGRIRRYDTRITGADALSGLRNRRERILALTEWMNSDENAFAGDAVPVINNQRQFERYWKPVLFPEMVSKKKRPRPNGSDWQREGDLWDRAEDIRWNTSYTERIFPEILWGIRNSGTMLRDWEEAVDWIYIEYEWGRITEVLSRETLLPRVKR